LSQRRSVADLGQLKKTRVEHRRFAERLAELRKHLRSQQARREAVGSLIVFARQNLTSKTK
jgi:hypothetical protein